MRTLQNPDKSAVVAFIALLGVLIPLEAICALLAYETVGAINSAILRFAVGLNIIPIVFYIFKLRIPAIMLALVLAAFLVPSQLWSSYELMQVQQEANRVVTHVYEVKSRTGHYPHSLENYKFQHDHLKTNIDYQLDSENDDFSVWYFVGTRHTAHWYQSDSGWQYYDD